MKKTAKLTSVDDIKPKKIAKFIAADSSGCLNIYENIFEPESEIKRVFIVNTEVATKRVTMLILRQRNLCNV